MLAVPRVLSSGDWHEQTYLVLEPVETRSTAASSPRARIEAMTELSHAFGVETLPLREGAWWQQMTEALAGCDGAEAQQLWSIAARIAQYSGDQVLELGAAHGDWSPWNMAVVTERAVVWDWERFRQRVPIGWDAIHFAVECHRHRGVPAEEALRRVIPRVAGIAAECGSSSNDPHLVFAAYLLDLGQRYLQDGQITGVSPRGPVSQWLLPPLTELLGAMGDRVGQ